MPSAAEYRALREALDQEKARSRAYYQEGQQFKEAVTHYEQEIERLKQEYAVILTPDEVSLVVMKVNLVPLQEALRKHQTYCDRQAEGYARLIASTKDANPILDAYYHSYVAQSVAIEDLMRQVDEAIRENQ